MAVVVLICIERIANDRKTRKRVSVKVQSPQMHLVLRIWKQTYVVVEWGRNDRGVQSNSVCKWKKEWVCNCEGDWIAPESISCSAYACAVSVWWCVCMVCVQNVDYAFILLFKMQFNMIMLSVWLLSFIIIIVNIKSKWVVFVSKLGIQWVSPLYLLYYIPCRQSANSSNSSCVILLFSGS